VTLLVLLINLISQPANAQDCQAAALAQINQLESGSVAFGAKVQRIKQEYPRVPQIDRDPKKRTEKDLVFCLDHRFNEVYQEGFAVFTQYKAFRDSQTGACRTAAQAAMDNLDRLADEIEAYQKAQKSCRA